MQFPEFRSIRLEIFKDGRIARLTIDTGRAGNILALADLQDLLQALKLVAEASPKALIIAGAADLSRGVDVEVLRGGPAAFEEFVSLEFEIWQFVECLPFVTIAGLRGYVVGNAAELVLACDFRVGATDMKILYPEIRVGFSGPIERLSRYVNVARAKEILLRASSIGAEEAVSLGLVTEVHSALEFDAALIAFASEFANHPPLAVRYTKQAIAKAYHRPDGASPIDQGGTLATYRTRDREEGIRALESGRRPDFIGE